MSNYSMQFKIQGQHLPVCRLLGRRELWSKIGRTFTSRIRVSNFAEMFILGYLLRKNMAPRETQTPTRCKYSAYF